MTTTNNDITGDKIKSKSNSEKYRSGWDQIFGEKGNDDSSEDTDQFAYDKQGFKLYLEGAAQRLKEVLEEAEELTKDVDVSDMYDEH